MTNELTFKGSPLTLEGKRLKVGDKMPGFECLDGDMRSVNSSSFQGKVMVISSVPSLDTLVCDMATRRFNDEGGKLGSGVAMVIISMDLPFAQKRWCGALHTSHITVLSDHKNASFGKSFGCSLKNGVFSAEPYLSLIKKGLFAASTSSTKSPTPLPSIPSSKKSNNSFSGLSTFKLRCASAKAAEFPRSQVP